MVLSEKLFFFLLYMFIVFLIHNNNKTVPMTTFLQITTRQSQQAYCVVTVRHVTKLAESENRSHYGYWQNFTIFYTGETAVIAIGARQGRLSVRPSCWREGRNAPPGLPLPNESCLLRLTHADFENLSRKR